MFQKILCLHGGGQINVGWVLFFFVGTVIGSRFSLVYLNDNPPLSGSLSILKNKTHGL
jgi:hypothetical protein